MYLIDSHTHLFDHAFDKDRDEVVKSIIESGVEKMVLPCCSPRSLVGIDYLCQKFPGHCFPTAGLHPEDIEGDHNAQMKEIFDYKFPTPIVAVGEIGIDKHYTADNIDIQMQVFDNQVQRAIAANLPVIIHCREAHPETFEVLDAYKGKVRGIFHCFSGDASDAQRVMDYGDFYFGIGGVVTFRTSGATLAALVRDVIPLSKIVLETDSPYLAPVPYRGKRNDSTMVRVIAHKIAEIQGVEFDEVAETTTKNSERVFGI
ncbi:MAG: TatD family hydrolase [Bacteroidales bacterium]|nr:TatD family hydrolase [Bacteroidales bacterium]